VRRTCSGNWRVRRRRGVWRVRRWWWQWHHRRSTYQRARRVGGPGRGALRRDGRQLPVRRRGESSIRQSWRRGRGHGGRRRRGRQSYSQWRRTRGRRRARNRNRLRVLLIWRGRQVITRLHSATAPRTASITASQAVGLLVHLVALTLVVSFPPPE